MLLYWSFDTPLRDLLIGQQSYLLGSVSGTSLGGLDLSDDVHALDDLSEDDVTAIEPRGGHLKLVHSYITCSSILLAAQT